MTTKTQTAAASTGGDKPADIAPAKTFDPSGAPIQASPDVDPSHPAVDGNPRRDTTVDQNKIDFNDPQLSDADAVAKALGQKTAEEAEADGKKSKD